MSGEVQPSESKLLIPPKLVEIYELIDPRTSDVRYIGKANCAKKRLASHLRDMRRRNTPIYAWMRKLESLGMTPVLRVVARVTEDQWIAEEKSRIFEARLTWPKLLNVADGGDEPKCSIEVRRANAKKLNASRNQEFHGLYLYLCREMKWVGRNGATNEKGKKALEFLKSLKTKEQQDWFMARWKKKREVHDV